MGAVKLRLWSSCGISDELGPGETRSVVVRLRLCAANERNGDLMGIGGGSSKGNSGNSSPLDSSDIGDMTHLPLLVSDAGLDGAVALPLLLLLAIPLELLEVDAEASRVMGSDVGFVFGLSSDGLCTRVPSLVAGRCAFHLSHAPRVVLSRYARAVFKSSVAGSSSATYQDFSGDLSTRGMSCISVRCQLECFSGVEFAGEMGNGLWTGAFLLEKSLVKGDMLGCGCLADA